VKQVEMAKGKSEETSEWGNEKQPEKRTRDNEDPAVKAARERFLQRKKAKENK
jgi:hypothetical protein